MKFFYAYISDTGNSYACIDSFVGDAETGPNDKPDPEFGVILALMRANRARLLERKKHKVDSCKLVFDEKKHGDLQHANAWAARFIAYVAEQRGRSKVRRSTLSFTNSTGGTVTFDICGERFKKALAEEQFVRIHYKQILSDITWEWKG